ncbi:MAG: hypothetical protein Q9195_007550 [Heterodermia aff. obscurata]
MPASRRSIEISWLRRPKKAVLISDPREVADVARVFDRMMTRFFVYEEYGAKYESTLRDMALASKHIPNWHAYERGIEALANSLLTANVHDRSNRKGLTFEDLLIKRVCKYPLLFADLYRHTPVVDGPEARAEVEKVLCRLRETTQEINKATNDHQTRARIQRSWQLQDLLVSPDTPTAPPTLRLLGHPILCGVLYTAYQSMSGMRGDFMLVVLFKSYLLLATPNLGTPKYGIVAIISLGDVRVENPDNGRGLQCYTALYAWKVAFESEQQLHEMILCACSPQEEEQWKNKIVDCACKEEQRQREDQAVSLPFYSLLSLDMKPIGQVFGLPGSLARRLSVQRASTNTHGASAGRYLDERTATISRDEQPSWRKYDQKLREFSDTKIEQSKHQWTVFQAISQYLQCHQQQGRLVLQCGVKPQGQRQTNRAPAPVRIKVAGLTGR